MRSRPFLFSRSCSRRRCSSVFCAMTRGLMSGSLDAYSAAALPARAPNTSSSGSEFDPRRLAPLMLTQAASPAAYRPGSGVAPLMSVWMPPIM